MQSLIILHQKALGGKVGWLSQRTTEQKSADWRQVAACRVKADAASLQDQEDSDANAGDSGTQSISSWSGILESLAQAS